MKAQLAAVTLDLGTRFSQAAQKAIIRTIEKADVKVPVRDASTQVTVRRKERALLFPEESPGQKIHRVSYSKLT